MAVVGKQSLAIFSLAAFLLSAAHPASASADATPTVAAGPSPVATALPVSADAIAQQLAALEQRFSELAQTKAQTDTALEQVRGAIIALRQLTAPKE